MIMPIPVIMNPAAKSSRAKGLLEKIEALRPQPDIYFTNGVGRAKELGFELASQGHPIVVAAGGDGTVNEVLNGIAKFQETQGPQTEPTALGILPIGTMNVMAHEMRLPTDNLEACWKLICLKKPQEIDLWKANGQYFCQLAGVGFDAQVVQKTSWKMKKMFGPISYVFTAAKLLREKSPNLSIHIEGKPTLHGSVVLVGNGKHYGGPVPVFREADNTDGLLDVLIIRGRGPIEAFQLISAITLTNYMEYEDLDYLQVERFEVQCDTEVPFEIDGELGLSTPVLFEASSFKLKTFSGH